MSDDEWDRSRVAMAQAIKKLQQDWGHQVQLIEFKARVAYARFVALKKQGFSVAEALQLCTKDIEL